MILNPAFIENGKEGGVLNPAFIENGKEGGVLGNNRPLRSLIQIFILVLSGHCLIWWLTKAVFGFYDRKTGMVALVPDPFARPEGG